MKCIVAEVDESNREDEREWSAHGESVLKQR